MSERIIVATFDSDNAAYNVIGAVKNLKQSELIDFEPKAGVMVAKDEKGNVSLKEIEDRPPWGTAVGTASGALIGLVGGASGAALGAALGAMTGLTGDAVMGTLDADFIDSVTRDMSPGKTALIVEANEMSTEPVDALIRSNGGRVYRQEVH